MKAAIFLNGEPPSEKLLKTVQADLVICADGAFNYLKKYQNHNTMTDVVLGDFDSFEGVFPKNAEIIQFPRDKDQTDSELALLDAIKRGATKIEFYGATGRRDDHSLANIGLLFKAADLGTDARIVTDYNIIKVVTGPCVFRADATESQIISIVPFASELHILDTNGLKYPIKDRVLLLTESLGISNVAVETSFSINIKSGRALIISELIYP